MTWADFRFLMDRGTGLAQRGMTSLRTRGLQATWQRVLKQFHRVPMSQRMALYLPEPAAFTPFAVPHDAAPRASIVIPVYNQFAHTLNCLRALAEHPPQSTIEIIVVDDGSSDETEASLLQVQGLRYHRRVVNGGFIAACNDGASLARGEYLVFLNNDTVPQPGWLDALLDTFVQHPDTGLAGAQLIYPDGRLQEAGGIVFADGGGSNYGRFGAPDDPRYTYLREADYCSGAAIAIARTLFSRLGGFDTRYAPAYYEDTDLGFAVRAAGLRVLYQPASRVLHMEGITSGTDPKQGIKAYQIRNRSVFAEKWHDALKTQPPVSATLDTAALAARRHSILVVDAYTPRPDRDSASLRLFNLMRLLREEGAHVVFFPTDLGHVGAYTGALQQLGVEVWYAPYAEPPPTWVREHGHRFDSVVVCRHHVMREWLPLLRRHAPQARVVFDSVDLHYLRERRGAELANDRALARAAQRTRELELDIIARSDATLVVSEVELQLLSQDAPQAQVEILSNLHHVQGAGRPFDERRDIVFVGGFRHPPNVDAVLWFVEEVWPRIHARRPDLSFHCIGGDTTAQIEALSTRPGVVVHGHVPDLDPYMDGVRLAVAPLRYGAGVKGKVNLSMAHGQPVVATACAVEGMHLRDGDDVLVADDPEAFAQAVLRAYDDAALWQRLADNGLRNVQAHFSLDAARDVVRRQLLPHR
ncbi:GT2 family glycosyltransferase/glycosyltransferase involved in cell wall biosynthesis [Lysobacter niastensis]|uniref:GT2 family glycosyltransferase/glycosyltransferase involved in cell wall biosynthesis n=2 Tax=Lysobacter niastensis TaxID=380629 RepID=A0ABU1WBJ4_9GAMM|nr:GT2 family glycosyltransferase/glycosyltransferase involved in cell wall biosynthesis [Lysobacter niastensis]